MKKIRPSALCKSVRCHLVDYVPAKASALPSVKGHLGALTLLWSQFDLCCLFRSALNMQDQNKCQNMPIPDGFKSLEQSSRKPLSYMQQFPIMTNWSAEWLVHGRNLSLERHSVKTNLLSYAERSVSCCIISSSSFRSNFKISFTRLFCHYCISSSVFFSDSVYFWCIWEITIVTWRKTKTVKIHIT